MRAAKSFVLLQKVIVDAIIQTVIAVKAKALFLYINYFLPD